MEAEIKAAILILIQEKRGEIEAARNMTDEVLTDTPDPSGDPELEVIVATMHTQRKRLEEADATLARAAELLQKE